jgi:hypothetical protein
LIGARSERQSGEYAECAPLLKFESENMSLEESFQEFPEYVIFAERWSLGAPGVGRDITRKMNSKGRTQNVEHQKI